ncbi:MAG: Rrf2 family transcriptional regulator [bacterium]
MSILSQKVMYALKALFVMNQQPVGIPIQVKEIANQTQLSIKYLEVVFSGLKKAGIVQSLRGSRGGYVLIKPLELIYLDDIMEVFEGPLKVLPDGEKVSGLSGFFDQQIVDIRALFRVTLKELWSYQQKAASVLSYSI